MRKLCRDRLDAISAHAGTGLGDFRTAALANYSISPVLAASVAGMDNLTREVHGASIRESVMKLENPQVDDPVAATDEDEAKAPQGAEDTESHENAESAPAAKEDPGESTASEKDSFQSRIDELTRIRREEQRRADALEREVAKLNETIQRINKRTEAPEEPQNTGAEKTLADFKYDEGAYTKYVLDRATKNAIEAATKHLSEQQSKESAQRQALEFRKREREFAKQQKDYFDRVHDRTLPFNDTMRDALYQIDNGPEVAFYLANNLDLADSISMMSPSAALVEIGMIRANLIAARKKTSERVASKAPPPVPKIEGSADASLPKDIFDPNLSDKEFNRLRRKQQAARRA